MLEDNIVNQAKNNEDLVKIYNAISILQKVSPKYDLSIEIMMLEGVILKETYHYDDLPSQKIKNKIKKSKGKFYK